MIPVMCIVQEGQIAPDREAALKRRLNAFAESAFCEQADIDWIVVPLGSGFTGAKPSSAVIVSLHANAPLETDRRASLLRQLGDICAETTGRAARDVVAAIRDPR